MQTNRNSAGDTNSSKKMSFKPVDYHRGEVAPEAAEGKYTFKCKKLVVGGTKKDNIPMLTFTWVIAEAHDEDNEKFVGTELNDYITFFPPGEKRGRMSTLQWRALLEAADLSLDLVPGRIETEEDFAEVLQAFKGRSVEGWIAHDEDRQSGEVRAVARFAEPKKSRASSRATDDDDADDERPAPRTAAKKSTTSKRR